MRPVTVARQRMEPPAAAGRPRPSARRVPASIRDALVGEHGEVAVHEEMIETRIRGRCSSRRASIRSWNGVVKASSRAACTDSQLPIMIVRKRRRPSAEIVRSSGPIVIVAMICSWTREDQREGRERERQRR